MYALRSHVLLFALLALLHPLAVDAGSTAPKAPAPLPSGTLLFLENCDSIVEWTTKGQIAHVAIVMPDGDTTWIYEAAPGKVRRLAREAYDAELARLNKRRDEDNQIRTWALVPKTPYTSAELSAMRTYLDEQLGRRYSVKNYVRGKPYDGIHCAELASNTLNRSGRYQFEECHKLHPQALYSAVLATHQAPRELPIGPPAREPWCRRSFRRTTEWFSWCGWSCREAWSWCW